MIERELASLKVRQFVLPAAGEAKSMWTSNFGFADLDNDDVCDFLKFVLEFHWLLLLMH